MDRSGAHAAAVAAERERRNVVVDDLVAITDDNPDLVRDEDGRVLMVTWTSYAGYDELVGQPTTLGVEVWSTVAPEMQSFCRAAGLKDDALALRLEQLLGLPMATGKDRVVELWVPADAMFRPSPDPEVDDSVASLDFGYVPAETSETAPFTLSNTGTTAATLTATTLRSIVSAPTRAAGPRPSVLQ